MPIALDIALGLLVALNAYATLRAARAPSYATQQIVLQCLLVWLLPVAGAIAVLVVLAADRVVPVPQRGMDDASRQTMTGIGQPPAGHGYDASGPGMHGLDP